MDGGSLLGINTVVLVVVVPVMSELLFVVFGATVFGSVGTGSINPPPPTNVVSKIYR